MKLPPPPMHLLNLLTKHLLHPMRHLLTNPLPHLMKLLPHPTKLLPHPTKLLPHHMTLHHLMMLHRPTMLPLHMKHNGDIARLTNKTSSIPFSAVSFSRHLLRSTQLWLSSF